MTDHSDPTLKRLLVFLAVGSVIIVAGLVAYEYIEANPDDQMKILRALIERTVAVTAGLCFLLIGLWAIDYVTPKEYLAKVEENPIACAILAGAVVYALAIVFVAG